MYIYMASRRGSEDYILMLNISEAKRLLEECVAKNEIKITSGHNYYLDLEL